MRAANLPGFVAAALQVRGSSAGRGGLGTRDQVRRLPHAAARAERPGHVEHPRGPRMDREVPRHRPRGRSPARQYRRRRDLRAGRQGRAGFPGPAGGAVGRQDRRARLSSPSTCCSRKARICASGLCASARPIEELLRKAGKMGPRIRFVEHFETCGEAVLRSACRMGLEGIVSKRLMRLTVGARRRTG